MIDKQVEGGQSKKTINTQKQIEIHAVLLINQFSLAKQKL